MIVVDFLFLLKYQFQKDSNTKEQLRTINSLHKEEKILVIGISGFFTLDKVTLKTESYFFI